MYLNVFYDQLMRWAPDWSEPLLNLAEAIDASADGRTFTVRLRSGIKWSDGEPYTADDLMFWYADVYANEEVSISWPSFMVVDGQPPTFEKVDDLTVELTFAGSNGMFIENLSTPAGVGLEGAPRHYLEQFHSTYNADAPDVAEAEGYPGWPELLEAKNDWWAWQNPERPTLAAWMVTTGMGDGSRVVFQRNPYYWKVDPDGRQLPYLDQVVFEVINDVEVILLKATNGEFDIALRHIITLANKPVLAQSRETGDYHFINLPPAFMNTNAISLNLTHKDDTMREIFQNKDFRIGLSHAINRQEVIDTVYQRQGEPWQLAPRPEDPLYDEEYAKQYTEFDVDLANQHLDQASYTERDNNDFRLGPNGERIRFAVDVTPQEVEMLDTLELVKDYWAEVGVDMQVGSMDRSLMFDRAAANDHDANVWYGAAGLRDMYTDPRAYMPFTANGSGSYGTSWATWFRSGGEDGEEPPEAPLQQMELYQQMEATLDPEGRADLMQQILEIGKEQFYAIGVSLPMGGYGVVKNSLHNVPEEMVNAWQYVTPGPTNPQQYFIE